MTTMSSRDDGRIHVCVRIRDVPGDGCAALMQAAAVGDTPGCTSARQRRPSMLQTATPTKTPAAATSATSDATAICVSALDNIVVMHDPRSVNDGASIARDANTLLQSLRSREEGTPVEAAPVNRFLNPAQAANGASYFECDDCIVSMDHATARMMPIIRDSDFLQPPPNGKQEDVYQSTASKAVDATLEGINSCVFAYGQTGSGKTYTLFGDTACLSKDPGVVLRAIEDLFRRLESRKVEAERDADRLQIEYAYDVRLSFFEIYQTDVTCLLSKRGPLKVQVTDGPPIIQGLELRTVSSYAQAISYIDIGLRRRQTGETGMNSKSSRSHAIVQITVRQYRTNKRTKETVEFSSVINMVDLAGSERQRTAKTEGKSNKEGIQINQSLTALARVINEISRGAKYINYRDNMLTLILKENLGGNSKTFMIATISPIVHAFHESCATLQYARNVRTIRNKPKVNKTYQTRGHLQDVINQLKEENDQLKLQIDNMIAGGGFHHADESLLGAPVLPERPHFGRMETMRRIEAELNEGDTQSKVAAHNGAAPLLITSQKVTTLSGAVPYTKPVGTVNVTPLDCRSLEWDMTPFFSTALTGPCSLTVEAITQRSMETTYWIQPTWGANLEGMLSVEVNGRSVQSEDPIPLAHGDVMIMSLDDAERGQQETFSIHFVDINNNGTRPHIVANVPTTQPLLMTATEKDIRITQLEKEVSKLLDVVSQQSRTIEYQCQRQNAVTLRSGNTTALPSRAASEETHQMTRNTMDAREPSSDRDSVRTIASPDIRNQRPLASVSTTSLEATTLLMSFNEAARPSPSTERDAISPTTAANSRPMTALQASRAGSAARADEASFARRYEAAVEENRQLQRKLAECQDAMMSLELDNSTLHYQLERQDGCTSEATTPRPVTTPRCPLPTAALDSPMRSSHRRVETNIAEMRDRLMSSKRERNLREDVARLEGVVEDLNQQVRSAERMMEDVAAEHSIVLHEAQSEAAELSRALLASGAEYDHIFAQLKSLQVMARRAEDAVTEVSVTAEAEMERRLSNLFAEKQGLIALCKSWKYRAVQSDTKLAVLTVTSQKDIVEQSKSHIANALKRISYEGIDDAAAQEAVVSALLEEVEKEGDAALVDVLKTNLRDLEREKIDLKSQVHVLATSLESQRLHLTDLEEEKARLERDRRTGDDASRSRAQIALKKMSTDLATAEQMRLELAEKLQVALTAKNRIQQRSQTANDQLRDEHRKQNAQLREQVANLSLMVAQQAEELTQQVRFQALLSNGTGDETLLQAREHLEGLLAASATPLAHASPMGRLAGGSSAFSRTTSVFSSISTMVEQFNAFPKTFVFTDEMVASVRMCLRMLMDRIKVELYVMNKASTQTITSILPTVQVRPDTVFQGCMTDIRRVVASTTKLALRIGCAWPIGSDSPQSFVLQLNEMDRRALHRSLLGLLVWFDHWSVIAKKDNASYIELIRNAELLLATARQARADSRTPTNALPSSETENATESAHTSKLPQDVDPTVLEGRKILAALQKRHNDSHLTKQLKTPMPTTSTTVNTPLAGNVGTSVSPDATPPPSDRVSGHIAYTARHQVDVSEAQPVPLSAAEIDTAAKFTKPTTTAAATAPKLPESVSKRLSRMSEDELVKMVMKDKKKIFATSKNVGENAQHATKKDAVLSFFRTVSPAKSKLNTVTINSPNEANVVLAPPRLQLSKLK